MNGNSNAEPRRWTLANLITAFRLAIAAPLMLVCAALGTRDLFLAVLAASFFSDAIDGSIARIRGEATRFGAMLDSWADVTAYSALAVGICVLWPDLVRREWLMFSVLIASFVLPSIVGLVKFGRFTSYHTWLVKLAVAATAPALFLILWQGLVWPMRCAVTIAVIAGIDEIAITALLREPRSNVRGSLAVWRSRRETQGN
ncbi:MAG: CDP-alcohol phosphatidyltransferase [Gammaproteobacteria bacterium]|nr:CDP-alcohol phosphatidyltransferase [Gammaproteobacteria bacterium]